MIGEELAQEGFAATLGIHVSGIDKIAAGFPKRVVNLPCFILGGAPPPVLPKSHGA